MISWQCSFLCVDPWSAVSQALPVFRVWMCLLHPQDRSSLVYVRDPLSSCTWGVSCSIPLLLVSQCLSVRLVVRAGGWVLCSDSQSYRHYGPRSWGGRLCVIFKVSLLPPPAVLDLVHIPASPPGSEIWFLFCCLSSVPVGFTSLLRLCLLFFLQHLVLFLFCRKDKEIGSEHSFMPFL